MIYAVYLYQCFDGRASDNTFAGGNGPNDVPGYQSVDDMIHTKNNAQIKQWDWMFAGVES
jgi:hypothetical protein